MVLHGFEPLGQEDNKDYFDFKVQLILFLEFKLVAQTCEACPLFLYPTLKKLWVQRVMLGNIMTYALCSLGVLPGCHKP
jgi:hypothetical protein